MPRQDSPLRATVALLVVALVASWSYHAFSQTETPDPEPIPKPEPKSKQKPDSKQRFNESMTVQIKQDNDVLLGVGDVRFGVVIQPGGGAVVANWQNHHAIFIDDTGRFRDLGIRLKHQHTGLSVPPQGLVLLEDLLGDYYAINAAGQLSRVSEWR